MLDRLLEFLRPRLKMCKVCFKLYDPAKGYAYESHMHQGQGPEGKSKVQPRRGQGRRDDD